MLKGINKTPVSYLQEQLLAQHICPKYELILDGARLQPPKFTFQVQAGEYVQEGSGKNKQEAKHKAAENMLKAMHLIEDEPNDEKEDTVDPSNDNHIGLLKEFCRTHNYPDPIYDLEENAGPAHSKIFKMVCFVSQIRKHGIAKTKKAAKHIAAAKMLQELQLCVKQDVIGKEIVIIPEVKLTPEEISEKYKNVKANISQTIQNPLAFYRNHHDAYMNLYEESPTLAKLLNKGSELSHDNSVQLAEDIAKELKVKLSISKNFVTSDGSKALLLVSMALTPAISEIGVDYRNASFKLVETLLILSGYKMPF